MRFKIILAIFLATSFSLAFSETQTDQVKDSAALYSKCCSKEKKDSKKEKKHKDKSHKSKSKKDKK